MTYLEIVSLLLSLTAFLWPHVSSTQSQLDSVSHIGNAAGISILHTTAPSREHATVFVETFDTDKMLQEEWPIERSDSNNWWVSSGAYLYFEDGIGRTIFGNLDARDNWVSKYRSENAADTAHGFRPQNIFRLVSRHRHENVAQELYAQVHYYEPSDSVNRNESNGILLFNRYVDEDNLYYTGIRVDGTVVIKKKQNGAYTTLAQQNIFPGVYDHERNPNLIPFDTWIGIRSEVITNENGSVSIKLYTDIGQTGIWNLSLVALDNGTSHGEIIGAGYGGIRTDFMDAVFDDYTIYDI